MQHSLSLEKARFILLAGKAIVTFQSKATGKHFTYKIRLGVRPGAPYFVSVLTGSDNESSYSYLGFIHKNQERIFHPGIKSKIGLDAPSMKAFGFVYENLMQFDNLTKLNSQISIYHEGKCCKCGRKLTTPESVERGIGPECWSRMH